MPLATIAIIVKTIPIVNLRRKSFFKLFFKAQTYNNIVKAKQLVNLLNDYIDKCNKEYEKSEIIPPPPEAPLLRTISETFFQNKDYPTNGKQCELCGKPVHSNSKVQTICDKCAAEYKF